MKRFSICINVFFFLIFCGCTGLGSNSGVNKVRVAIFVEQKRGQGVPVVEMKVYSADPKVFYVSKNPVLEVGQGILEGAYLIEGQDKILSLQLRLTSRGSALLEDITTRFRQQRLFIVVAMPDKTEKKKIVSRCIGVIYEQSTITDKMLQFTPDAGQEEAITIVNGLNKAIQ